MTDSTSVSEYLWLMFYSYTQKQNKNCIWIEYLYTRVIFLPLWRRLMAESHLVVANTITYKQWPLGVALVCAVPWSKSELEWVFLHWRKPTANTSHLTGRTGCALAGFYMQMCACINTWTKYTLAYFKKWLQAYRV